MGEINLYRRYFPAAGERLVAQGGQPGVERVAAAFAAAGLAALDRAVQAETAPRPVIDRLDLLVLR
jgi:hypothetical protein